MNKECQKKIRRTTTRRKRTNKKYAYLAYNKQGLIGIPIVARNKTEAQKFARQIHGKGAIVKKTKEKVLTIKNK